MGFAETMIFYHLIGVGVATAVFLSDPGRSRWSRGFRVATAVVFWPLYLPILLSRPRVGPMPKIAPADVDDDAMSRRSPRSRPSWRRRWRASMAGSRTCWPMRPTASAS